MSFKTVGLDSIVINFEGSEGDEFKVSDGYWLKTMM